MSKEDFNKKESMRRQSLIWGLSGALLAIAGYFTSVFGASPSSDVDKEDPYSSLIKAAVESPPEGDAKYRYDHLTDEDFEIVAKQINVEVAAMKAVVSIEAGPQMKGFWAPGVPVINFDQSMYNRFCSRAKDKSGDKNIQIPKGLTGYPHKEWSIYVNAARRNAEGAMLGTFWGMFQIGGFNYKACGCSSVQEMVRLMSFSELEQLELFAAFITNSGMVGDLRARNWAAFARKYNGTSYARRGYHTKMANAYAKFKNQKK